MHQSISSAQLKLSHRESLLVVVAVVTSVDYYLDTVHTNKISYAERRHNTLNYRNASRRFVRKAFTI